MPGQKFDPLLESNEVQFEIVEGEYLTPDDLVEPGSFEEPPQE